MKRNVNNVLSGSLIILLALFAGILFRVARAQILPPSLGKVEEKKRTPVTITRSPSGSTSVSKLTNTVLFVLTEPPDAEVAINGKRAGNATNGEFRTELARGHHTITVSAGSDYEPVKKTVVLKSRQPEVVRAALVSRYGLLRIGPILEGASVFIDDQPVPSNNMQLDRESNTVRIDNLSPGEHKISYQHPDYVPLERRFKITPSSEYLWTYKPEPATVELKVVTDPDTSVYVDGEPKGKTTADGVLKRGDIRIGRHEIKLVKEDFQEYVTNVQFEFRKPVTIEQKLTPIPTSVGFDDNFNVPNLSLWTIPPAGLTVKDGRLYVEGAASVGTRTGYVYRDIKMTFHLRLENAGGAAWAVRVKDSGNYYLFYLSGPQGLFPNTFNTYIVRNNQFDPNRPDESHPLPLKLVAGGQYQIIVNGIANRIEHQIMPAESGETINMGVYEDRASTFLLGGIGFRNVAKEKFSIDDLFVNPR